MGPNQAAHAAVKRTGKLRRFYECIQKRDGAGKAIVATARKLLTIVYQPLKNGKAYEDRSDDLTARKLRRMKRVAAPLPTPDLARLVSEILAEPLTTKQLTPEAG